MKVGIGLLSAVFGVGGGFGIVFSGLIVEYLSWRWLFVAGAIPVAASIALVHRYVPESPIKLRTRIDVPGAILLAGALSPCSSRSPRARAGAGRRPPSCH